MKMGIERVLKENFANLGPVISVDPALIGVGVGLTTVAVEQAIEKVVPAIKGMGGTVELVSVDSMSGAVKLKFSGPPRLKVGIELVVKDVELVKSVEFV